MTNNNQGDRLLRGYLSSRLLLLVVGITTPVGILVVNGAAFVMRNLQQFRIGIAVCALISSLVLNGLTASWLLRLAGRRQIAIYMRHQEWAGVVATTVVVATSIGAAIFTYIGMGNPSHLPDTLSVLTALAALLVPIGITYFSRIFANSREQRSAGQPANQIKNPVEIVRRKLAGTGDEFLQASIVSRFRPCRIQPIHTG